MTFNLLNVSQIRQTWENRDDPEAVYSLATFYWRALLLIAFGVLLLAFWFGFQELSAVSQAESVSTPASAPRPPFTMMQLQAALDAFSAKQAQYQTLSQLTTAGIADPSK